MKVPAAENVLLNVAPGAIFPELNDPSSLVAVCVVTSLLVQVTVPPTATETGLGEYAVVVSVDEPFTIETGVPVVVGVFDGDDGELDPQPIVKTINPASTLNRNFMCVSIPGAHRKAVATSGARVFPHNLQGNCNSAPPWRFPKFEVLSVGVTGAEEWPGS